MIDENEELKDMAMVLAGCFWDDLSIAQSRANYIAYMWEAFIADAQAVRAASHAHRILPQVMAENTRLLELLRGFVALVPEPQLVSMGFDSPPEHATEDDHQLGYLLFETKQALSHQQKDEG